MKDAASNPLATHSAAKQFVHLHLHSEYSLLDGGNKLKSLVDQVKALGMDSVALTDHGNLHGAMEFYTAANAAGIKPILGIEAYVAQTKEWMPVSRHDRGPHIGQGGAHLVLLAMNLQGWKNLVRLSSDAFANGFYGRPRMDRETLAAHSDGLIAINGHLSSSIANHLSRSSQSESAENWNAAIEEAKWHAKTFGPDEHGQPRFYIELQRHSEDQDRLVPLLIKLARELNLPLVCDNDAHFLRAEDHDVHDTLCCISMGKTKSDAARLKYPTSLYVKSPEEMWELFADVPEALLNTVRIADRCNVTLPKGESHAPLVRMMGPTEDPVYNGGDLTQWFEKYCSQFETHAFDGNEKDLAQVQAGCVHALRQLCEAGAIWRYGKDGAQGTRRARLERELAILGSKGITPYFLIVWDFVNWARQNDIPAMARGSGVGTMVGFVLGLSNADPEEFGLLFERFADPDRSEYPDIDIDFCQDGRARVIDYVRAKYGYVAQIITFGRLKARAAIKDVGRVMGFPPHETQRLSNLVPDDFRIRLSKAIEQTPQLKHERDSNPSIRNLLEHAEALEDHARNAGVHAAGVIIATQPLENIVPLCRASKDDGGQTITQWDGPTCEKVGLLKMDFLGLRTLSTITLAKKLIRESLPDEAIWRAVSRESERTVAGAHHPLDLDRIRFDDQRIFEEFRRGHTAGIFQFESGGMKRTLQQIQPDRLEDLIAANALFRPGPMENIPSYAQRKGGKDAVPKVHPTFDAVVAETFGIMVYQEQVMLVLHHLGGISLRHAYTIIKAISKKNVALIASSREDFVKGSGERGVSKVVAEELFALIQRFADYGFNKSHAAGYAILAYQTAYLKTYFPASFLSAVLTFESLAGKVEDWRMYLDEARTIVWPTIDGKSSSGRVGITVAPPDINESSEDFSVRFASGEAKSNVSGHIRFGLRAIKGAGTSAIRAALEARATTPFKDFMDFCERVDPRAVNKSSIEALVKAGAFDSLHGLDSRASLAASIEDVLRSSSRAARDRATGQMDMFGALVEVASDPKHNANDSATTAWLRKVKPWDSLQALSFEKESLGMHVSGHPLDAHRPVIRAFCNATSATIGALSEDAPVVIGGILSGVRTLITKKGKHAGQAMALFDLLDVEGKVGGVVFAEDYARFGALLQQDAVVALVGHVDRSRETVGVRVSRVLPLSAAAEHLATRVDIVLDPVHATDEQAMLVSMRMVAGTLRQLSNSVEVVRGGRPVEVHIEIDHHGRTVRLMPGSVRIVPSADVVARLSTACDGRAKIVVRGGWTPPAARVPDWKLRQDRVGQRDDS
ncbi:MAG: DNA polymerase III subunit alpha [Planctomycetota bacterium]|nr:DNA polymerase III subunit alpha [Planctomycetota bacterium]